jgi:hypothetical protein
VTIYHKHHIVPRHAGGTDDPINLVELTLEEHAEAHRVLFEQFGRWQDLIAWRTLSGQISVHEARVEAVRYALAGKKQSPEHVAKRTYKGIKRKPASEERKQKVSETLKAIGHAPPPSAREAAAMCNRGSFWVTDGTKNKKLRRGEPIPDGWRVGRVMPSRLYPSVVL